MIISIQNVTLNLDYDAFHKAAYHFVKVTYNNSSSNELEALVVLPRSGETTFELKERIRKALSRS